MSAHHTYIDSGVTAIALYVGFTATIFPVLQMIALCVGIITGILTIMNMVGYVPRWFKRIKLYFKKISK
jgi:TM2 domain-containing membrane protein YozV